MAKIVCPTCKASGTFEGIPCPRCKGEGHVKAGILPMLLPGLLFAAPFIAILGLVLTVVVFAAASSLWG